MDSIRSLFVAVFFLLLTGNTYAQSGDELKQFIINSNLSGQGIRYVKELRAYYEAGSYEFSWTKGKEHHFSILASMIGKAEDYGLSAEDYHPSVFRTAVNGPVSGRGASDTLLAEIRCTDAALHFMHDLLMGNRQENVSYNGLKYAPGCYALPDLLHAYVTKARLAFMVAEIEPKEAEYIAVKGLLNLLQQNFSKTGYREIRITSTLVNRNNQPLLARLSQLGLLGGDTASFTPSLLKEKLKEAQRLFNVLNDGVLRKTSLQALNVPLETRIKELMYALNTIRWLSCIKQAGEVVIVNIPSATLLVYAHGKPVLESRIIVGKQSTPTPTLSSEIKEVILYPYWNVPYKIATKELLPKIKRNRNYLDANNYQVLNLNGRVVDPASVNWRALGASYFPYVIRQSTGCDNALGLIKLNFYNPFSVYLHDTPGKSLFSLNRRYFSHGCMRVEKAMDVGRYILQDNRIAIDTLTQKGCLVNQSPIIVPVKKQLPVFVLYNTVWTDSTSKVRFYEDVYGRFHF